MRDEYEPQQYVKLPIPITAQRMREAFALHTSEGVHEGKAGDYLLTGVRGDEYPCDAEIFRQTYQSADEAIDSERARRVGEAVLAEIAKPHNARFSGAESISEYAHDRLGMHTFGGTVLDAIAAALRGEP